MRSYPVKENHIGSAVQRDPTAQTPCYFIIRIYLEKYGGKEHGLCFEKLYPTNGWQKNYWILWTHQAPSGI